jgi:hypothetical protein
MISKVIGFGLKPEVYEEMECWNMEYWVLKALFHPSNYSNLLLRRLERFAPWSPRCE